ncbi:MAG: metallophosphoesterase family protein [Anaerolineae bacterium]|nr:metallophosphoesterase family protein [Anaerolineae bacterium]
MRQLPFQIPLRLGELRLLLVCGSPPKINEYLFADRPVVSLDRLLEQAQVDVLVCGHTNLPYHRILPSGRQVINMGSVGKPKDGDPRADYVILEGTGAVITVHFIRVPYNVERTARH